MMATAELLREASSRHMYRLGLHENDSIAGQSFSLSEIKHVHLEL